MSLERRSEVYLNLECVIIAGSRTSAGKCVTPARVDRQTEVNRNAFLPDSEQGERRNCMLESAYMRGWGSRVPGAGRPRPPGGRLDRPRARSSKRGPGEWPRASSRPPIRPSRALCYGS